MQQCMSCIWPITRFVRFILQVDGSRDESGQRERDSKRERESIKEAERERGGGGEG